MTGCTDVGFHAAGPRFGGPVKAYGAKNFPFFCYSIIVLFPECFAYKTRTMQAHKQKHFPAHKYNSPEFHIQISI
jgi:hypothetical protein